MMIINIKIKDMHFYNICGMYIFYKSKFYPN